MEKFLNTYKGFVFFFLSGFLQEDKMRDKPGFEHLNEPLHVLVEAELPANIIDSQLIHAREILQELLKPVVSALVTPRSSSKNLFSAELGYAMYRYEFTMEVQCAFRQFSRSNCIGCQREF
jgi:hypothetical protein